MPKVGISKRIKILELIMNNKWISKEIEGFIIFLKHIKYLILKTYYQEIMKERA